MKWIKNTRHGMKVPIKSWCENVEESALKQAKNLSNHPIVLKHVALMPDCHTGYGMPIGGVIGCLNGVIPNAVGVDIGCGMMAVETGYRTEKLKEKREIREIIDEIKKLIPVGEGHSFKNDQIWDGFKQFLQSIGQHGEAPDYKDKSCPGWLDKKSWSLAAKNLGTLGGGNHFIEMQKSEDGFLWIMLHSGSRNLGYRIANHYHNRAVKLNNKWGSDIPSKDLAFLPVDSIEGQGYIRDMNFALKYAFESRKRMMANFKKVISEKLKDISFLREVNIHHNYASLENHFGENLWVHRKGATSAKIDEIGIIPGSMGTSSYIVQGLGNEESFMSCSHGAGRIMSRTQASNTLTMEACDKAMDGIVFDRWKKNKRRKKNSESGTHDFGEAPLAYKNIDEVINDQMDLIKPLVKLSPIGVIKG